MDLLSIFRAPGMTKVKFSKSEESGALFVERRRAALERYLNRLAQNTVLRKDEDFREFLENPSEVSRSLQLAILLHSSLPPSASQGQRHSGHEWSWVYEASEKRRRIHLQDSQQEDGD